MDFAALLSDLLDPVPDELLVPIPSEELLAPGLSEEQIATLARYGLLCYTVLAALLVAATVHTNPRLKGFVEFAMFAWLVQQWLAARLNP